MSEILLVTWNLSATQHRVLEGGSSRLDVQVDGDNFSLAEVSGESATITALKMVQ
jgi:hypothetical protein